MATTKAAPKTSTKKTTTASEDPQETLTNEVLLTHLHRAIVRLGEPARLGEIVRETGEDGISVGLARHAVEKNNRRFVAVDRRWDITQRYLDDQRPVERTLQELITIYGAPFPVDEIAVELGHIYHRASEHFDTVAPRLLRGNRFFPVANGLAFGLRSWLLDTTFNHGDDVLFYNYLSTEILAPYETAGEGADWTGDLVEASRQVIAANVGAPVDNRIIQYFAWKALGEDFDPVALYDALYREDKQFLALPNHRWILMEDLEPVRAEWHSLADSVADLAADEPIAEAAPEAPAKPLEVTDEDLKELIKFFDGREDTVTAAELVTNVLEITASARTFEADTLTLTEYLKTRPSDFLWVGTDLFRAPETMPPYIGQVPESLTFPALPRFETSDGEILDQMLADEAFEEGLAEQILDPLAQDVNDQEASEKTQWPEGVSAESPWLRLVVKAHHKEIGTFPLSQIPFGFFPTEPNIVELVLRDTTGTSYPIYVDYDVQLIYGLFDVYSEIAAESGAVFHLEKTEKSNEYKFVFNNETDSGVFISPARYEELTDYRAEIESGNLVSTYDIVRHILDHYRKGSSFLTLLTEVNVVRRTPRRLIASILSSYTAFHQRANRWTFDPKKEPEGFDKRKSGYIIKK